MKEAVNHSLSTTQIMKEKKLEGEAHRKQVGRSQEGMCVMWSVRGTGSSRRTDGISVSVLKDASSSPVSVRSEANGANRSVRAEPRPLCSRSLRPGADQSVQILH